MLDKADGLAHYNDWVTDRELTIDKVREYLARDASDNSLLLGKYTALQTSGSTGEPLTMVRDMHRKRLVELHWGAMTDSSSLIRRIESRNGLHTLDAGARNGLGSRRYRLAVVGE